ncbi:hypothetical protein L4D06_11005 [Enterovibrio makurazakiensis]|uniref:hypothetical protein n=1 Tax=Enterovibrio makurazakiensis TaxID=2910232 RepID=UPI003D202CF9
MTKHSSDEGSDNDSLVKDIIPNEMLMKTFVSNVVDEVDRKIKEREDKRHRIWNFALFFLGLLGVAGATALVKVSVIDEIKATLPTYTSAIRSNLKDEISKDLKGDAEMIKKDIEIQGLYTQLIYASSRIDGDTQFSKQQLDEIIFLLEKIPPETFKNSPGFAGVLERVIDSFYASGLSVHIQTIVDRFPSAVERNTGIAITLAQHYGRKVIFHYITDRNYIDAMQEFIRFEVAVNSLNYAEVALPYRLLMDHLKANGERSSDVLRLIGSMEYLEDSEREVVIGELLGLSAPNTYMLNVDFEAEVISQVALDFISEYELAEDL